MHHHRPAEVRLPPDLSASTSLAYSGTAASLDAAAEIVTEALAQKMASTLSVDRHELDTATPSIATGLTSLVAVELRNWLAKEVRCDAAILDFLGGATIATIVRWRRPEASTATHS